MKLPTLKSILRFGIYSMFWGWNLTFLFITFFGIMPLVGLALTAAALNGQVSFDFMLSLWLLLLIPGASLWLAVIKFWGKAELQLRLFYGLEIPLFLLCLVRLFALREMTPGSGFLLVSILFAILIYGYLLLRPAPETPKFTKIALAGNSLVLIMALYLGTLLSFYALPLAWVTLRFIVKLEWAYALFEFVTTPQVWPQFILGLFLWIPLSLIFLVLSISLFISSPLALLYYYLQSFLRAFKLEMVKSNGFVAVSIPLIIIGFWVGIFVLVNQQPQAKVFALLDQPVKTQEQKKYLLAHAQEIRAGLLNAYLYPYRYLSAREDVNHIQSMYQEVFGWSNQETVPIQNFYNLLISPLLYQGHRNDVDKAANLYASLFDTSMQKGEKEAVIHALHATALQDQAQAGLLNVNQEKVWLVEQHITTTSRQDETQVELYEVYENQTPEQQEIFYYFTLPENAAVTGLWLGNSSDLSKRQAYVVAPRGAAQRVYHQQVQQRCDPALLEQVGPRQYRLRAFPVPPHQLPPHMQRLFNPGLSSQGLDAQARMHLWLTYSLLNNGKVISPELLEKRNIFWTSRTQRFVNDKEVSATEKWFPAEIPTGYGILPQEISQNIAGYHITAKPTSFEETLTGEEKMALLVDTSYSMRLKREEVKKALEWTQQRIPLRRVDVYVSPPGEALRKVEPAEWESITCFGEVSDTDLWNQAVEIQNQKGYDGVFVLTDQGSYELAHDKTELAESKVPVWFVHLDQLAPAYVDGVMSRLIASHGGVATQLEEAHARFVNQRNHPVQQRVQGGLLWEISKPPGLNPATLSGGEKHDPIAAKILIDYLASEQTPPGLDQRNAPSLENNLDLLDQIHQIAKSESVVTPYSSMIVLVNDWQKEQLKKEEEKNDRFDRTVETGVANLPQPGNVMVSAVPEPETWILLTITVGLFWLLRKKFQTYLAVE